MPTEIQRHTHRYAVQYSNLRISLKKCVPRIVIANALQFDEDKTLYGLIIDELDFNGSLAFNGFHQVFDLKSSIL